MCEKPLHHCAILGYSESPYFRRPCAWGSWGGQHRFSADVALAFPSQLRGFLGSQHGGTFTA